MGEEHYPGEADESAAAEAACDMTDARREPVSEESEAMRALACLFLEVPESVANDVGGKVRAAFKALVDRLAEVEVSNEMLRGCLSDAQATIERLGQDRQYHMNCINRLAKRVGALGETSETVIDKAEQQVARLRECVEYYAQTAIGARAVEALRETGRQP